MDIYINITKLLELGIYFGRFFIGEQKYSKFKSVFISQQQSFVCLQEYIKLGNIVHTPMAAKHIKSNIYI